MEKTGTYPVASISSPSYNSSAFEVIPSNIRESTIASVIRKREETYSLSQVQVVHLTSTCIAIVHGNKIEKKMLFYEKEY